MPLPPYPLAWPRRRQPQYTNYRSRPGCLAREGDGGAASEPERRAARERPARRERRRRAGGAPPPRRRSAASLALPGAAALGASAGSLSLVLFLVSAQIQQAKVSDAAEAALERRRLPADGAEHDPRARLRRAHRGQRRARRADDRRAEPVGLDHAPARRRRRERAALDPARHGRRHPRPRAQQDQRRLRDRRPALAIQTVEQYLGIDDQPPRRGQLRELPRPHRRAGRHQLHRQLRDLASINGGSAQRRLHAAPARPGTNELDGEQALALARTRKNDCRPQENDRSRARRQQKIINAIKAKVHLVRDLHPPAVGLVGGAEGDPLGHVRPDAARPDRRRADRRRQHEVRCSSRAAA